MSNIDEKALEEFLKQIGESFSGLSAVETLLKNGRDFLQHLGATQYYSEEINKEVFLLSLEVETFLLNLDTLHVTEHEFLSIIKHGLIKKKKAKLNKKMLKSFVEDVEELKSDSFDLHEKVLSLTKSIKKEVKNKV